MKKITLTLALFSFSLLSFGQGKPEKGDILTEARFNVASFSDNFELPSLRVRYAVAPDMLVRVDLSIQGGSDEMNFAENPDGTGATGVGTDSYFGFGFAAGVEKHMPGNNRFSPYMGAQLGFSSTSFTEEYTNTDGFAYMADYSENYDISTSAFGAGLICGADYWVSGSFYLGLEVDFGVSMATVGDATTEMSSGGTTTKMVELGGKSMVFGESIIPSFRIGYNLK